MCVDEKRLERIEIMVADLIRIVGNTNAMVEEMRDKLIGLENRFEGMEKRFDGLENRFEGLEKRFDGLESRLDGLENRFGGLESRFDGLENRLDGLDSSFSGLENRYNGLESKVDALQIDVSLIKSAMATREDISLLNERFDFQVEKLSRQEEDIYRLKRVVGVR